MPIDLATIDTPCDPELDIGMRCDIVKIGDEVDKIGGWDTSRIDPETLLETCEWDPADFTGYVPTAFVLDAAGVELAEFVVTPAIGDATGDFRFVLAGALVDAALRGAAVRWCFKLTAGAKTFTLVYARFQVT